MRSDTIDRTTEADQAVAQLRIALVEFARENFDPSAYLCACGRPSCPDTSPDTAGIARLLRAAATEWRRAPHAGEEPRLRETLTRFVRCFGIDRCPDGNPTCFCAELTAVDTQAMLRTVADTWHRWSGNIEPTHDDVLALAGTHAHNLRVLDAFALVVLDPGNTARLRRSLDEFRSGRGRPWPDEARAMSREALASWVPLAASSQNEVNRALDSAISVAGHARWTTAQARDFTEAVADACAAILTRGFAHDLVCEILYAPFTSLASLDDLDGAAEADLHSAA